MKKNIFTVIIKLKRIYFGDISMEISKKINNTNEQLSFLPEYETTDIWNKCSPIEKSSYLQESVPIYFNINNLNIPSDSLTMLDLFCGAGGFSIGCSWSGFHPVFGIDYLIPAIQTWNLNHQNSISCLGNICQIDPNDIKHILTGHGIKHINLIVGGVPCQGFSLANRKRNDYDQRNYLFLEYMKFVKVFLPDYIILENVAGMRSTARGQFEKDIKTCMEKLGYTVTAKILNAVEYGVPQYRQRILFVGVKNGNNLSSSYTFPIGRFLSPDKHRTVAEAISDLPELGNNDKAYEYNLRPQTEFQALMRGEGEIIIEKPRKLFNHVSPNHPVETIKKINSTIQGMPMYTRFKQRIRLSFDAPSPTQLAGGIRPQFQFGHPNQPRGLTIRERARIQSFPDSYKFIGGIVQERILTGNAVPPLMIHEITKPIAKDIKRRNKGEKNV